MNYTRHLLLKKLFNTRDLGGFPTSDGGVTRYGVFLRSEAPCGLPESDIQALLDYGMTGSMDLRSDGERIDRPSSLKNCADYYEEPLFNRSAIYGAERHPDPNATWVEKYIDMAEVSRAWAVSALNIAAEQKGCLLYHCTTGKDRTGLLTCYLLSIAGVPEVDIAADYCVSEIFLEPVYRELRAGRMDPPETKKEGKGHFDPQEEFFHTPASAMLGLMDYFDSHYGSTTGYLAEAGVKQETMDRIREKLVES